MPAEDVAQASFVMHVGESGAAATQPGVVARRETAKSVLAPRPRHQPTKSSSELPAAVGSSGTMTGERGWRLARTRSLAALRLQSDHHVAMGQPLLIIDSTAGFVAVLLVK